MWYTGSLWCIAQTLEEVQIHITSTDKRPNSDFKPVIQQTCCALILLMLGQCISTRWLPCKCMQIPKHLVGLGSLLLYTNKWIIASYWWTCCYKHLYSSWGCFSPGQISFCYLHRAVADYSSIQVDDTIKSHISMIKGIMVHDNSPGIY